MRFCLFGFLKEAVVCEQIRNLGHFDFAHVSISTLRQNVSHTLIQDSTFHDDSYHLAKNHLLD